MLPDNMLDNARICLTKLEQFNSDFDELRGLYSGKVLFNDDRRNAQHKLRALKESLAEEAKRLRELERKKQLTHVEEAYYFPAIHQTYADLTLRWNSVPDAKWHS